MTLHHRLLQLNNPDPQMRQNTVQTLADNFGKHSAKLEEIARNHELPLVRAGVTRVFGQWKDKAFFQNSPLPLDPDYRVRLAYLEGLEPFTDGWMPKVLLDMIWREMAYPILQARALRIFARQPDSHHPIEELLRLWELDLSPFVRGQLQQTIAAVGKGGFLQTIRRWTSHTGGAIRQKAFKILVSLQDRSEATRNAIRKGLLDVSDSVQTEAAYGLTLLDPTESEATAYHLLWQDYVGFGDYTAHDGALQALATIGRPDLVELLVEIFFGRRFQALLSPDPIRQIGRTRNRVHLAGKALLINGSPLAIMALLEGFHTFEGQDRQMVYNLIKDLPHIEVSLHQHIDEQDLGPTIIHHLARRGVDMTEKILARLSEPPTWREVKLIKALGYCDNPRAHERLMDIARDRLKYQPTTERDTIAESVIEALGVACLKEALLILEAWFKQNETHQRLVVQAIGQIGGKEGQDFLWDEAPRLHPKLEPIAAALTTYDTEDMRQQLLNLVAESANTPAHQIATAALIRLPDSRALESLKARLVYLHTHHPADSLAWDYTVRALWALDTPEARAIPRLWE